ncbi:hypothetical protein X975_12480, partial [Stegodyphus mimosarum]
MARRNSIEKLQFLQCNLQRCESATLSFAQYMFHTKTDVALILEPYTKTGSMLGFPSTCKTYFSNSELEAIVYNRPLS